MYCSQPVLLSIAYLAPARYYSKFLLHPEVRIEAHENYSRQSYRNRCTILSANGPFSLSIPVKYTNFPKTGIRDVLLDYDTPWNKIHWQAIVSSYRNSPFFEYYYDELQRFYSEKFERLFDYDMELTLWILKQTGIETRPVLSALWESEPFGCTDMRQAIHPKAHRNQADHCFKDISYVQVFQPRFGFTPGLSMLDLLFNTGPEALSILEQTIK